MSIPYTKPVRYFFQLLGVAGLGFAAYCVFSVVFGAPAVRTVEAQTDRYLESRISQMEQRFYQIESRLNRIEQDSISRRSTSNPILPDPRPQDIDLLRSEVSTLRLRLGEAECGLLKVDERTLTAARRLGARTGSTSSVCRQDWASPVQLSARP